MTYEEFEAKLKALLREATDAGLDVEKFCDIVDHVLEYGWAEEGA